MADIAYGRTGEGVVCTAFYHGRVPPQDRRVGFAELGVYWGFAFTGTQPGNCVRRGKHSCDSPLGSRFASHVSIVHNERLAEHGIAASTGTVGASYDNALAGNVNGSYKNKLIHTRV